MFTTMLNTLVSKFNGFWLSVVRTAAPIVAGFVIGQLARWGLDLDESAQTTLVEVFTLVGAIAWYLVARGLEQLGTHFELPWLATFGGLMLGLPAPPDYGTVVGGTSARGPPATM
ncbi:hypothetical protein [Demequina sp.]|uniref:hypothetical protein n=1 Tax=Demequina sp. TaxID=2050685 RepID=UPI0025C5F09D|nr:hypothetical protein [Demequina sp.]